MATVNVGKCRSLIEIELILCKIKQQATEDKFVFPLEYFKARHSPMHDASRLQMVTTFARQYLQYDYLDIHQNALADAAVEAICSHSPGIAAVRLAKGIRLGTHEIDRREVLKAAVGKMQSTDSGQFEQVVHGRSLDLICVSGSKVQHLRPLFSSSGVVKEHSEMQKTMQSLASFVNQQSSDKLSDSFINSLGLFTTELIKNTQEHAVKDHAGKPYLAHIEGMMCGWTRLTEELFSEEFSGNTNLEKYWSKESIKAESGATSLRVFEVSYFDSGPGLVSSFTNRRVSEMTLEEERSLLLECLKHKSTSKPEDAAGEGLPTVLSELREIGGLIRIRSGRLSIFNAFSEEDLHRDLFGFEDWSEKELAPVEGAVISILVPLRAK